MPQTPLLDSETLLLRTQRHWALFIAKAWRPALLVLVVIIFNLGFNWELGLWGSLTPGGADLLLRYNPIFPEIRLAVTLFVLSIAGLWVVAIWDRWSAMTITVTDYRLIRDTGHVPYKSYVIGLDRILDVSTDQTPMGRLLDYGSIRINDSDLGLDFIPQPQRFAEEIFIHVTNLKKGGAKPPPGEIELLAMEAQGGK